jgi:YHS domain-containing protein
LFSSICAANEICRHESYNLYIPDWRLDWILLGFVPFGYRCWMSRFQMVFSSIWIEVLIVAASWCSRNNACKFDSNLITYDDCMKLCRSFACLLVYRQENCGRQFDRPENVGCIVQWFGVGHTFFFCSQNAKDWITKRRKKQL